MKHFASRTRITVAVSAAAMAVVWAFFVPYAYPWPSVAWAVLACGVAAWVGMSSVRRTPLMSDVISNVEESPMVSAVPAHDVVSGNAVR